MADDRIERGGMITSGRRLIVNTILNMLNQVLTAVINFAMVGFFLDTLGQETYGVWILIGSIFGYRAIMAMGLNSAVNRHIPVYLARGEHEGIRGVVSTAFAYFALPGFIIFLGALLLFFYITGWFSVPAELHREARFSALIIGATYGLTIPLQVYSAVLSSFQRYDLINLVAISSLLCRTMLIVLLLLGGYGMLALALIYSLAEVGIRGLSFELGRRQMGGTMLAVEAVDFALMRSMVGYGVSTILYMSGAVLIYKCGDLVIGSMLNASDVSRFFIATTPVLLLTTMVQVFAQAMKPAVSELDEMGDHARVEEIAILSQKYSLLALIPGAAFLLLMGRSFLEIWVGDRIAEASALQEMTLALSALTIGASLRLSQHTNFVVLLGRGDHRAYGVTALVSLASAAILAVLSIRVLDAGIAGVAIACALPMAVLSIALLPAYFHHRTGIPFTRMARRSLAPAAAATAPAVLVIALWQAWHPAVRWSELVGVVLVASVLTGIGTWLFALSDLERKRILRMLL